MIRVFCNRRGSGKTKKLIELANSYVDKAKGDSVYIDKKNKNRIQLNNKIRFVATEEFKITDCSSFYGAICGIISGNFDIENIYIDEFLSIVACDINDTYHLFNKLRSLTKEYNINLFINIDSEKGIPNFIKEYLVDAA